MFNKELETEMIKYIKNNIPLIFLHGYHLKEVEDVVINIKKERIVEKKYYFNITQGFATDDSIKVSDYNELLESLVKILDEELEQLIVISGAESLLNNESDALSAKFIDILVRFVHRVQTNKYNNTTIIFNGSHYSIPSQIRDGSMVIENSLPDIDKIYNIIDEFIMENKLSDFTELESIDRQLIHNLKGLSYFEIKQALSFVYYEFGIKVFNSSINDAISKEIYTIKEQMLKKMGTLSIVETDEDINNIIGLDGLIKYIESEKVSFENIDKLNTNMVDLPKGILILGEPGTGKSMTAKATSNALGLKLIKFDISKIMGKYVGESEKNIIETLKIIEHMSPCVLWIDEIEKAFSGVNDEDNQVLRRVFGILLTWMSDDNQGAFVVGTANNIEGVLPPEFLRKGRFDEIFYVNKPSQEARGMIFESKLKKRNIKIHEHNEKSKKEFYNDLSLQTEEFTGAEIEYVCNRTAKSFYLLKDQLPTSKFAEEIYNTLDNEIRLIQRSKKADFVSTDYEELKKYYKENYINELDYINEKYDENSIEKKVAEIMESKINNLLDKDLEKILNKKQNKSKYRSANNE